MRPTHLPVASLTEGTLIDLEEIVDWLYLCPENDFDLLPDGGCEDCDSIRIHIQFEFARVDEVIPETDDCVLIHTTCGPFGLPPDLLVPVIYEDES